MVSKISFEYLVQVRTTAFPLLRLDGIFQYWFSVHELIKLWKQNSYLDWNRTSTEIYGSDILHHLPDQHGPSVRTSLTIGSKYFLITSKHSKVNMIFDQKWLIFRDNHNFKTCMSRLRPISTDHGGVHISLISFVPVNFHIKGRMATFHQWII